MSTTAEHDIATIPASVRAEMTRLEGLGWQFRRLPNGRWYLSTARTEYVAGMTLWEQVNRAFRWQIERDRLKQ